MNNKEYLIMPQCERKKYLFHVNYVKEHGAVFDSNLKRWFITSKQDRKDFVDYLPRESVVAMLKAALMQVKTREEAKTNS